MFRIASLTVALALSITACSTGTAMTSADAPPPVMMSEAAHATTATLDTAIAGNWRDPKNAARDAYRHPRETLEFFGVDNHQTLIEITPGGGGWYAEILAPYLRDNGRYIAAMVDPAVFPEGRGRDYQQKATDDLKSRLAKYPAAFDHAQIVGFDPKQLRFAEPGSVDTVLTFRNVHNWVAAGSAPQWFAAFFAALKPGGTLGVVDHRAKPGTDLEKMKKSGYLTEALVMQLATDAGFRLQARSEINANAKDTADHPNGVWTLPPSNDHDPKDNATYTAIGESDRMTLRFVKPAANQ